LSPSTVCFLRSSSLILITISQYDSPSPATTTPGTPLMAFPPIENADLHDFAVMTDLADDDDDIAGGEDSSDSEDKPLSVLRDSNIQRHYWRKGDVRYTYASH
jgi:hypothetical protein